MIPKFQRFLKSPCGASTVDFVILTAGIIGFALIAFVGVQEGTETITLGVIDALDKYETGLKE